jgi:DNA mismatch repair protein MutS
MKIADHQTLHELQIISPRHQDISVFRYFDKTFSYGGREALREMIKKPFDDIDEITAVQKFLKEITKNPDSWHVKIPHSYVDASEHYYSSNVAHTMSQDVFQHWFQTYVFFVRNPAEFYHMESGLLATVKVFQALADLIERFKDNAPEKIIEEDLAFLGTFINARPVKKETLLSKKSISRSKVFLLDYHLRRVHKGGFRRVLDIYYKLDAYLAIVRTSMELDFSYPIFAEKHAVFDVQDLWHPLVSGATRNSLRLDGDPGLCLLTGANTSGKTTFLKSIGIAIYLAHLGWPVPAVKLRLSFFHRLFTSVHLSDNLNLGYSHFYSEVMRIREIGTALRNGQHCFVMIDELFRGTNHEDAEACSSLVLDGFSNFKNSLFMVSTHLLELVEKYVENPEFCFYCFRTSVVGGEFRNTFLLEQGISTERVGRLLMEKAGIPELLAFDKKTELPT